MYGVGQNSPWRANLWVTSVYRYKRASDNLPLRELAERPGYKTRGMKDLEQNIRAITSVLLRLT